MSSKRWLKCSVKSVRSVREKNILCERKNSPRQFSNVLFLTDEHRRTDFTKVHRDIKSTDSTERYSYCWVLGDRC